MEASGNNYNESQNKLKTNYLKSKIQIGTVHSGNINYQANQTVFHHDDINVNARKRKNEVKAWLKHQQQQENTNTSSHSPSNEWNLSTKIHQKICERKTRENFVLDRSNPYQYNFRAEKLGPKLQLPNIKRNKFQVSLQNEPESGSGSPRDSNGNKLYSSTIQTFKRTQEMPINTNLMEPFENHWNLSTQTNSKKDNEQQLHNLTMNSLNKTKSMNQKLKNYISPIDRSKALLDEVRKQKREGSFTLDKHVFHQPEEPINRTKLVNQYAVEPSLKFKTNYHSGVWELNKTEGRYGILAHLTYPSYPTLPSLLLLLDTCGLILVLINMKVVVM